MDQAVPRELITVDGFGRIWLVACTAWTVACALGAIYCFLRDKRKGRVSWILGAFVGPIGWGLWELYRRRIAYDPHTEIAGLHRVDVLLEHLVLFAVVGGVLGYLAARLIPREPETAKGDGAADADSWSPGERSRPTKRPKG